MSQLLNFDYIPDPVRGRPLFNAHIYIGEPDTDPVIPFNRKLVTATQQNGTEVNLPQPIRTGSGGVPIYNGSPVRIRISPPYSIKVLDSFGAQKYYFPNIGSDSDSGGASELVLTAEYVSDNSFRVLGNYTTYVFTGMEVTLKNEDFGTTFITATVNSTSFDGTNTTITTVESVVSDKLVSVSFTAWLSDFITELNKFIENGEQAISDFNDAGQAAIDTFNSNTTAALAAAGYNVVGNFSDGVTVNTLSDAVWYAGDPLDSYKYEGFYSWNGTFPKVVNPGDNPISEQGWSYAATGYTKQSGAIMLFGQTIDVDQTIPLGQNALSVNPAVSQDVKVTVSQGSTWRV